MSGVKVNTKATIKSLNAYKKGVKTKADTLRDKLAEQGLIVARMHFGYAQYDGDNDVTVKVSKSGKKAIIKANGKAVCFIEFGSGITYGFGHPMAGELGMGPSTWSDHGGQGHWADEGGWYYEHGHKSMGNRPAMAMYYARQDIVAKVTRIAREVF